MSDRHPCPCCGHLVFGAPPGSYDICPICSWEDDGVQLGYPLMAGGANARSLFDSQQEFARCGACEPRLTHNVRHPNYDEPLDPNWRPFAPATDPHLREGSPQDDELWRGVARDAELYYWRDNYWLSPKNRNTA